MPDTPAISLVRSYYAQNKCKCTMYAYIIHYQKNLMFLPLIFGHAIS